LVVTMFRISTINRISKVATVSRSMSTLVYADHNGKAASESVKQLLTAAKKVGKPVTVLVAGKGVDGVAKEVAALEGVSKVIVADNDAYAHQVAENVSLLVSEVQAQGKYTHIIASTSPAAKSWLPRFAATQDVQPIADVIDIKDEATFVRPTYAGNAVATVRSKDALKVFTVRPTAFGKDVSAAASPAPVEAAASTPVASLTQWVSEDVIKSERPELAAARVVVSGGRGMKSGENFAMLNELADLVGGAVGASRAAVDAGFVPNDLQVGQTGKVVAPELYIAVGISGAIQHVAGMKDSKTIVAINKDPEAPIFQIADYGLVGDLFTAVPELTAAIKAGKA